MTAALMLAALICTPIADRPLMPVPGFMTAFGTGMLVINLLLAALLLSKGSIEKRADAVRLGAAYLYVGAIFVPLLLSFKDGFVPGTLIGTPVSSLWLWSFWHAGFACAIAWYGLNVTRTGPAPSVPVVVCCVIGLVTGLALLSTLGIDYLPPALSNGRTFFADRLEWIPNGLLLLNLIALMLCLRLQARTTEQLWVTVAMVAACIDLWLTLHGNARFALGWYLSKCGSWVTSFVVIISLFQDIAKLYHDSAEANLGLKKLAHRDGLTGAYNRRHFDERVAVEWRTAFRTRATLSLLLIDVDFFKQFNDEYGHLAGDEGLRAVARGLNDVISRPADVVARYGGEEFVVLLPHTDAAGCRLMAERAMASINRLAIPHKANPSGWLTMSIGTATMVPQARDAYHLMIDAADKALYFAKRHGRNRIADALAVNKGVRLDDPLRSVA